MDDPNNTNQPLDPSMPPTVPSVPEDITPQNVPPATVPEPTVPVLPPVEMPFPEPTPEPAVTTEVPVPEPTVPAEGTTPSAPWINPAPTPETPSSVPPMIDQPIDGVPLPGDPVSMPGEQIATPAQQTPPVADVPMPKGKSKKKILPIIGGIMALLLVVGVAGAAYYVSNQLATRQVVAPNAPESEPLATSDCQTIGADCTLNNGDERGTCVWGPEIGEKNCLIDEISCSCGWFPNTQGCNIWCPPGGDGGGGDTPPPVISCKRDGNADPATSCSVSRANSTVDCPPRVTIAPYTNFTFECGTECGNNNLLFECCCMGVFPQGTDCSLHACPTATVTTSPINGDWSVPWGACSTTACGTVGEKTRTCNNPAPANGGDECLRNDGTLTTLSDRVEREACSNPACPINGDWSVPWGACSTTACGEIGEKTRTCNNPAPSNNGAECERNDGTLTSPSNRVEREACEGPACQTDGDWSNFSACSVTACGEIGEKTRTCNNPAPSNNGAECERNDGTLTSPSNRVEREACSTACPGACTIMKVYKKLAGGTFSAPLNSTQLEELEVGDVVKAIMTANMEGLRGRFLLSLNDEYVGQVNGVTDGLQITSEEYTIPSAGTYKIEGQVTIKANIQ